MQYKTNYRRLLDTCLPIVNKEDKDVIKLAYQLMCKEYDEKKYVDGQPLLDSIIDLTRVVVIELNLGFASAISAMFSKADLTNKDIKDFLIENNLQDAITIINSLNRINDLPTDRLTSNVDNFTGIMLSMVGDIRAILLSLADHLYMMRQKEVIPIKEIDNLVRKVENIYVPLSHKLGLYRIKAELEELLFNIKEPEKYAELASHIEKEVSRNKDFIKKFIEPIETDLSRMNLKFSIKSRTKTVSSVHNKMINQKIPFSEIYDLYAIRIIIDSSPDDEKADCWKAYSVVTNLYHPEPSRMRDWITRPRTNGYESLHITVQEPSGRWVEVQIRTKRMDIDAELGNAAHWRYKGHKGSIDTAQWLNSVRKILENPEYSEESLVNNPMAAKLPEDVIYVFTPTGDLRKMKDGATVLDFAFELHTGLGAKCIGGKVNHKIVQIRQRLKNGDMVEIMTSKNQSPNIDWLGWVATTRAKNKIKRYLKEAEYKQAEIGKDILRRKLSSLKVPYNDETINKLIAHYKFTTSLELFQQLADNKIEPSEIKDVLSNQPKEVEEPVLIKEAAKPLNRTSENTIVISESAELQGYILAQCCNPVLGDEIFGFVMAGGGVKVHRATCPNAPRLRTRYPYRVMNAVWSRIAEGSYFITTIHVSGVDQLGILNSITQLISNELKMEVRNIALNSKTGRFEGYIKVSVRDSKHVDALIKKLANLKGVTRVKRLT